MSTITMEEWVERLEQLTDGGLAKLLRRQMERAGLVGVSQSKRLATGLPRVRSGRLRASIRHELRAGPDGSAELVLMAGSSSGAAPVRYAAAQEYGGTIRPKRSQYLAIPVGPALTPAGVPRYHSPRDVPELTYARTGAGQPLFLHEETGEVWYVLKRSVTLRGHRYMRGGREAAVKALSASVPVAVKAAVGSGESV